jgi:hypothetical protein
MRPGWRTATRRASETVWRCPGSAIGARPEHGYVNIPSLFWIVPGTYAGQHLVADDTLAVPWTLSWDEDLTTTTTAPCPDDPDQMCTSSETHTRHGEQSYTDTYEVEVQAIPTRYVWDFSDGRRPRRCSTRMRDWGSPTPSGDHGCTAPARTPSKRSGTRSAIS